MNETNTKSRTMQLIAWLSILIPLFSGAVCAAAIGDQEEIKRPAPITPTGPMKPIEIALPLVAALWASATVFMTFTKELNDKRDKIILGEVAGKQLPLEHRKLLLQSDWLPLVVVLIFLTLAFAAVSLLLPFWLGEEDRRSIIVWMICTIAALYSVISCLGWIVYGVVDYRMMAKRECSIKDG